MTGILKGTIEVVDNSIPSWAQIASGSVVQINSSTIQDVVPSTSPGGTFNDIINAWTGGAIVTWSNGALYYLVRGGGHGDYAGNEVYLYGPLMSENPAWQRHHGPTNPIVSDVLWQSDGLPSISHTRNTLVGGPTNEFWMFGQGGVWESATVASSEIMRYDFASGWDAQGSHANYQGNARGLFVYNPNDGMFYMLGGGQASAELQQFNPLTSGITTYASFIETGLSVQGAIDTVRNTLYAHDYSRSGAVGVFDLDNPNNAVTTGITGPTPPASSGVAYDAIRDRYTALDSDMTTVYELNPVTLEWTTRSFSGSVSNDILDYSGHYNRWQYVPELEGTIFVGAWTSPVAFYKS